MKSLHIYIIPNTYYCFFRCKILQMYDIAGLLTTTYEVLFCEVKALQLSHVSWKIWKTINQFSSHAKHMGNEKKKIGPENV